MLKRSPSRELCTDPNHRQERAAKGKQVAELKSEQRLSCLQLTVLTHAGFLASVEEICSVCRNVLACARPHVDLGLWLRPACQSLVVGAIQGSGLFRSPEKTKKALLARRPLPAQARRPVFFLALKRLVQSARSSLPYCAGAQLAEHERCYVDACKIAKGLEPKKLGNTRSRSPRSKGSAA